MLCASPARVVGDSHCARTARFQSHFRNEFLRLYYTMALLGRCVSKSLNVFKARSSSRLGVIEPELAHFSSPGRTSGTPSILRNS
ncbi:hypothetical protein EVAR_46523_1 [Eumeta japonica]|uniref:Uncharacterized protein n=1 Tax=Eumeta variegata TaxID=151549 RepID=A0A4C1WVL3_EUMVA|nr:hypothetical protein EVAR_46523_1 [Eumeta japonica]